KLLRRMDQSGICQIIMATHAPILMAYPSARLLRLAKYGLEPITLQETDHYRLMREFCADPASFIETMMEEGSSEYRVANRVSASVFSFYSPFAIRYRFFPPHHHPSCVAAPHSRRSPSTVSTTCRMRRKRCSLVRCRAASPSQLPSAPAAIIAAISGTKLPMA